MSSYPALFCIGNPLLDMQANNGEALLEKYDLKANDAILAEEKHLPMSVVSYGVIQYAKLKYEFWEIVTTRS